MNSPHEPTNVGLSENAHAKLKRLKEEGHFAEMVDAYRFGIALALAHGVVPDDRAISRTTIFSVATVDPDREIASAIRSLTDQVDLPVYKLAERLAEWGVNELALQSESGDLDLSGMMQQALAGSEVVCQ